MPDVFSSLFSIIKTWVATMYRYTRSMRDAMVAKYRIVFNRILVLFQFQPKPNGKNQTLPSQIGEKTPVEKDAGLIADEVFEAFNELAEKNDGLIKQFREAFNERAENPLMGEPGGQEGLVSVLADLLWTSPPESYLNNSYYSDFVKNGVAIDADLKEEFHIALKSIATRYQYVLLSMDKRQKKRNCSLSNLLKALFAFYIDNKAAYPY